MGRTVLYWVRDLLMAGVIAFVVIVFVYQPVKVEGTSMLPALADQERVFVNKFTYRLGLGQIERGDMVVFWYGGERRRSYIKRVVGLPGEVIGIEEGTVVVNGRALEERYLAPEYRDYSSMPARRLGRDEYFVLGDHRNSSQDSRTWGLVPRGAIYGKAVFVYWPLGKIGLVK